MLHRLQHPTLDGMRNGNGYTLGGSAWILGRKRVIMKGSAELEAGVLRSCGTSVWEEAKVG